MGCGVRCPKSSVLAQEKVDARPSGAPSGGDFGLPISSADARRREVRTQVRGRVWINGEMIHAGGSGPRGGEPWPSWGLSKDLKDPAKDAFHSGP